MEETKNILEWLNDHPGVTKMLWAGLVFIVAGPLILTWIRGGRIRKATKQWDSLFIDLSSRVTDLYKEVADVQRELAKARGELATAQAELRGARLFSDEQQKEIDRLKAVINNLESREAELKKLIDENS